MTAVWFAALALLLAGPVPALLARARWTWQVPRAALVLWQAIALGAVLATLGAGLASLSLLFTEEPGFPFLERHGPVQTTLIGLGSALVAVVTVRFWVVATLVGIRTRRRRNRHREMVDLLHRKESTSEVDAALLSETGVRVLTGPGRVAYCVPGVHSRVVVSDAMLNSLTPEEVRAVLAHERAHLRARHDLVLEGFTALHAAFPRVVSSQAALDSVRLLVEMLADDSARRRAGSVPLARALVALAGGPAGESEMLVGSAALARVRRLAARPARKGLSVAAYAAAAAVLGAPTLGIAVPWLQASYRALAR
ncbi:M56 family metallopeptidase [Kineococcus rhizosphaerae]|uniref:Peptidase M48-like protein n=1 Tax=Kineococcus rhizosphaerae TaxID=559628 RepID=A0A2T0RAR3_9ACTN|nr:M56 family metallopeptidase [Kineococcus rhizosphaerae]PRY18230.1 peptidase M48-like protein [Kineococcus rhizosphaerae]